MNPVHKVVNSKTYLNLENFLPRFKTEIIQLSKEEWAGWRRKAEPVIDLG
jgi:hypothetical protein